MCKCDIYVLKMIYEKNPMKIEIDNRSYYYYFFINDGTTSL